MAMQLLTFKTPVGYNKAKPITECLHYFLFQAFWPFLLPAKV